MFNLWKSKITEEVDKPKDESQSSNLFGGLQISSPVSTVDDGKSSFTFLNAEEPSESESALGNNHSAFSFIGSSDVPVEESSSSAFSFMASESNNQPINGDLVDSLSANNVKIAKVSSAKTVKKKKRSSRVGFGREDADGDNAELIKNDSPKLSIVEEAGESETISTQEEDMEETVTTRKVAMDESIQTKDLTIIETIIPIAPQYSPVAPPIVENESSEMPTVPTSSSVAHEERAVKVQAASHIDDDLPSAKEKTESVNVKNHSIEILAALSTSIERFARSKYSAMLTMDQVEDRIKDIKDEAAILKQIISKKEVEQLKLAEIEEFEKADDLTNEILALQNRKESLEGQTISLAEEYETSRKHFEMLKLDYKLEFTTFVEVLSVNETQLDAESAKIKRINQHKLDIDRSRLKSETERMQIERKHFEEEREALLYDSKVVEDTISSQSGDLENEKFDIDTSILGVQCEIRELEEKLAAKRLEEKNLLEKSSIIDSQIEDIRKKFKRQLDDISDRREKIDLAQKEYSDSEERLLAEQREFDLFSTKVENEYDNAKLLARAVRINCAIIEILTNHIVSESADENHVYSSDLSQQARIEYNQAVSLVEDCKNSKLSKEHCIQKLLSEISYIDSTIPSLETEKKNYASSKRFKEAAVSAKEIKDLLTKKDDITLELEALRLSLEKYDEELKDLENDASRKMELIVASEKDANVDRYNNLYRRCKRLKDVILAIDVEKSKLDGGSCLDSSAFTVALTSKSYLQEELQRIEDDLSAISAKYPNENFSDQTSEMDAIHQEEVMAECQDEDIANSTIEADEIVISHMDTIIQMDTSNTDEIKNLAENYPDDQSSNNNTLRLQAIALYTEVERLDKELQASTAEEDYERAAELNEMLESKEEQIEKILALLQCNREDLFERN